MMTVGEKKLRYDMWGQDSLVANKLESLGDPMTVTVALIC